MLWGIFWFIFAIASCAYNIDLINISAEFTLSAQVASLGLLVILVVMGALVGLFSTEYGLHPQILLIRDKCSIHTSY